MAGRSGIAEALTQAQRSLGRGDLNRTVEICRRILRAEAENPDALHLLAIVANRTGKRERALEIVERALAARPDDPAVQNTRGVILTTLDRLDEAEAQLRACLALAPTLKQTWQNLVTLKERGNEFAAALDLLSDLDRRFGADPGTLMLRATVLQSRGEATAALEVLNAAEALDPQNTDIRFARANLLLLMGRLAEGWPGFELRRQRALGRAPPIERPTWSGTIEPGIRLLVYAEHGMGDVIQFARYVPYLAERGVDVTFECPPVLLPLMRTLPRTGTLVPGNGSVPECDVSAPIMSLPHLMGHGLDEIEVTGRAGPYLHPEPDDIARLKADLDNVPGVKVGLCWQGNPSQSTDRDRSIPIGLFEGVMALAGVTTVSLQNVHGEHDIDPFKSRYRVLDWPHAKDGFYPLACLIRALDLVVTSDTAIAHLAGALGARTWLLLSAKPGWRWLLQRETNPWYPSMRLFRQAQFRDWGPVFANVESALAALIQDLK